MTSEPTTQGTIAARPVAGATRRPLRLKLKPSAQPSVPTTGYVDGGWWPWSRDLSAELPPLLTVLARRLGPIERVCYQLADWDPAEGKLRAGGHITRLGGFRAQRPHTVDVLGPRSRLTLLVIPPESLGHTARQSLMAAGRPGNRDTIADLLAAQPDAAEMAAEGLWETEGGYVHRVR